MKTLSARQPWANLIVYGLKDVENRSRRTNYKGRILIHSPVKDDERYKKISDWSLTETMVDFVDNHEYTYDIFINSAIIGSVEIVDCINNSSSVWAEHGSWHWILKNPILFDEPILDVKGKFGLWEYSIKDWYYAIN